MVLGANLWSTIHGINHFLPRMAAQADASHIVNTASAAGLLSTPASAAYNVSKHGIVTLSETLYHELRAEGSRVGVSVLCPAWVKTGINAALRNRPARYGATSAAGELSRATKRASPCAGSRPPERGRHGRRGVRRRRRGTLL